MQPIKEKGGAACFAKMYDIRDDRPAKARELGNVNPGDGIAFCGRGLVQLTRRANYRKATQRLRALGQLLSRQDLETNPDLAMHPDVAAPVLFIGTREGWFTGQKLSDYLGGGKADWTGSGRLDWPALRPPNVSSRRQRRRQRRAGHFRIWLSGCATPRVTAGLAGVAQHANGRTNAL